MALPRSASQEVTVTDPSMEPRRVNFFAGQLLSPDDLQVEQEYHRGMRYLHNRLHGHGVVDGLEVSVDEEGIHVSPGLALDVCGREVIVATARRVDRAAAPMSGNGVDLVLSWAEEPEQMVLGRDGAEVNRRWVERPQLELTAPGDVSPDALLLARLTWDGAGAVSLDLSVRRSLRMAP